LKDSKETVEVYVRGGWQKAKYIGELDDLDVHFVRLKSGEVVSTNRKNIRSANNFKSDNPNVTFKGEEN